MTWYIIIYIYIYTIQYLPPTRLNHTPFLFSTFLAATSTRETLLPMNFWVLSIFGMSVALWFVLFCVWCSCWRYTLLKTSKRPCVLLKPMQGMNVYDTQRVSTCSNEPKHKMQILQAAPNADSGGASCTGWCFGICKLWVDCLASTVKVDCKMLAKRGYPGLGLVGVGCRSLHAAVDCKNLSKQTTGGQRTLTRDTPLGVASRI